MSCPSRTNHTAQRSTEKYCIFKMERDAGKVMILEAAFVRPSLHDTPTGIHKYLLMYFQTKSEAEIATATRQANANMRTPRALLKLQTRHICF